MAGTSFYEWPPTGAVAPTALQVADQVTALITSDGGAGNAVVTHNMGLSVADLAVGRPVVTIEKVLQAASLADWIVSAKAANTVTLTQLAAGGATANLRVHVRRPHSIGR